MHRLSILYIIQLLVILSVNSRASNENKSEYGLNETVQELGKNAVKDWIRPLVSGIGVGMNSGWSNSSKANSMLNKYPIGISIGKIHIPGIKVSNEMKTFDFQGLLPMKMMLEKSLPISLDSLSNFATYLPQHIKDTLASLNIMIDNLGIENELFFILPGQPTIIGSPTATSVPMDTLIKGSKTLNTIIVYNAVQKMGPHPTDTINISAPVTLPFRGLFDFLEDFNDFLPSLPGITFQIGTNHIPVIGNMLLGFRFLPSIPISDYGTFQQFGLQIQYEWLHFLPKIGTLPLNSSVMFAFNNLRISANSSLFRQINWITMLNTSLDFKKGPFGLGIFCGIGIENSKMKLDINMDNIQSGMQDFTLSVRGDNVFRFQIGPRFTIGFFEIWADCNVGSITCFNAGVTLCSLNGNGF